MTSDPKRNAEAVYEALQRLIASDGDKPRDPAADPERSLAIATHLGAYRRFGGDRPVEVYRPRVLASVVLSALDRLAIPARYSALKERFADADEPMPADEAIESLRLRDDAQLAYEAIAGEIDPAEDDRGKARTRFALLQEWIEADDRFFDRFTWVFFAAADWLAERAAPLGHRADRATYPWLFVVGETLADFGRVPVSLPASMQKVVKSDFARRISDAFARLLRLPANVIDAERIAEALSPESALMRSSAGAAEDEEDVERELIDRLVRDLPAARVPALGELPPFLIVLLRDPGVRFLFLDDVDEPLAAFAGATVWLGDEAQAVEDGAATFLFTDMASLYLTLAELEMLLVIRLADGTEHAGFRPTLP